MRFPSLHPVSPRGPSGAQALVHGLYSQRVRSPLEEEAADALRAAMAAELGSAHRPALDEFALRQAARELATVWMIQVHVGEDVAGVDGLSDRMYAEYVRATGALSRWLDKLGMTPASRAKLGMDVAKTVALHTALAASAVWDAEPAPPDEVEDEEPPADPCTDCGSAEAAVAVRRGGVEVGRVCRSCAHQRRERRRSAPVEPRSPRHLESMSAAQVDGINRRARTPRPPRHSLQEEG
jgi:hypothetical protein